MATEDKLDVCKAALQRIADSDPGPAHFIAKAALLEIEDTTDRDERHNLPRPLESGNQ